MHKLEDSILNFQILFNIRNMELKMSKYKKNTSITLYNVCSVHRGDIMSTSGGYYDACGGTPLVHRGEYIGGC